MTKVKPPIYLHTYFQLDFCDLNELVGKDIIIFKPNDGSIYLKQVTIDEIRTYADKESKIIELTEMKKSKEIWGI
ncbi:hypothetical protein ADA01nite_31860 [Aneurinibacillus danicus]|jgi:hypothetical protein|uniref:Uncharacterized protein n=1 Tax=Aneurinibacillus danicus TaxID=267746 RepID=A0A511V9Y3_9BACL|nr:hypothetical protein ADA01nite_31860 [Aneurinibacillus danicus]